MKRWGLPISIKLFPIDRPTRLIRAVASESRDILEALLPTSGKLIRGQVQNSSELMRKSGINSNIRFQKTIKILAEELKLITPVDPTDLKESDKGTIIN